MQKAFIKIQVVFLFSIFILFYLCRLFMEKILPVEHYNEVYPIIASAISVFFIGRFLYFYLRRKQASFLENENYYKAFFYANPNPLWIYDVNSLQFVEVNNAAVASYGYTRAEFLSMNILQIRPEEDHERVRRSIQESSASFYKSGKWRHIRKNGDVITVNISSQKIHYSGRECEMIMALDITHQLYYEESLRSRYLIEKTLKEELEKNLDLLAQSYQEKGRLADIIEKVSNIVIITDKYGVITWVNGAFSKHTGYTFQEAVGRDTSFLHGPETDQSIQEEIMASVASEEVRTFEVLNYTKESKKYWVALNISPIYNKDGELTEYISIQNVITDRKERELQIEQQNVTLRNIAWMNSHALRKPVASIISLAELGMEGASPDEVFECHKLIKLCSEELDHVVREIGKQVNSGEIDM